MQHQNSCIAILMLYALRNQLEFIKVVNVSTLVDRFFPVFFNQVITVLRITVFVELFSL